MWNLFILLTSGDVRVDPSVPFKQIFKKSSFEQEKKWKIIT